MNYRFNIRMCAMGSMLCLTILNSPYALGLSVWVPKETPSDSSTTKGPCPGLPNPNNFKKFDTDIGVSHSNRTDRCSWGKVQGNAREIVEKAETIEILVSFDRDNSSHVRLKKAGKTKREDLIMFRNQVEYFRYLIPTVELGPDQFEKTKELLLRPDAVLDNQNRPKSGGVILGPRHVIRIQSRSRELLLTVSKINLPSLWISGESIEDFGALLHPAIEAEWHDLIEEALGNAGHH